MISTMFITRCKFVTQPTPNYLTTFVQNIPKAFVHENSLNYKDSEKMVFRTSRNSSWDVKIINKDGRFRLSSGWCAFFNENCFKAGDICKFELLARLEMMVHIVSREEVDASKIISSKRAADGVETATTGNFRLSLPNGKLGNLNYLN